MYIPKPFQMPNAEIHDFIKSNPFGILITASDNGLFATHIPFHIKQVDDSWVLFGHLAAANPHAKAFHAENHLAIFTGAHAYVSSSWYTNVNVSTWNYEAIHVSGKIKILSENELLTILNELTNTYEKGQDSPLTIDKIPEKMISAYIKEIVGFSFHPTKVEAKAKLSQNRNIHDHSSIVSNLEKQKNPLATEVAKRMKKNRPN